MRILVARCEIAYHGRATTRLGAGDRVILLKDDGSLCVHTDGGFKPLNYMSGPTSVTQDGDVIRVYRPASNETLVIVLHEVFQDSALALADDAVLEREDAELQIHRLLERAPETIEPGLVVLDRERFTDTGPIDLFCRDTDGRTVVHMTQLIGSGASDDRGRGEDAAVGVDPPLPDAGQSEHRSVVGRQEVRDTSTVRRHDPLVPAVGGQQAAPAAHRVTKRRLVRHSLDPRVEQCCRRWLVGP